MQIINLTPHEVNVLQTIVTPEMGHYGNPVEQIFGIPSSGLARCKQSTSNVDLIAGISITETQFGEVEGLPEPSNGVYYIVSRLVMAACPDRTDLLVPNEVQRNDKGQITHCLSLARN